MDLKEISQEGEVLPYLVMLLTMIFPCLLHYKLTGYFAHII